MAAEENLTPEQKLLESIFGRVRQGKETSPPDAATAKEIGDRLKGKIEKVLTTITYREREIIKLRYGLGDSHIYTIEEVGRIFKVTRERVRQIEAKAVRKLMQPIRARRLSTFLKEGEKSAEDPPKE